MTTQRRNYEELGEIELPAALSAWIEAAVEQAERDPKSPRSSNQRTRSSMSAFARIEAGLEEAVAFVNGEDVDLTTHVVEVPTSHVRDVRRKLGLSQDDFARAFGVSVGTVRGWEQGRRTPNGSARTLLEIIEREPEAVRRALALDTEAEATR